MYTRKAFSPHYIKRIFQELYFSYIRYNNLFTVHFKEEFAFYEPSYWLLYTLDTTFGFTEYQRSVCLISNRMFTSFRFLSSSLVWYSPVEDLKNLLGDSLGCSFRTILRLLCHYADICVSVRLIFNDESFGRYVKPARTFKSSKQLMLLSLYSKAITNKANYYPWRTMAIGNEYNINRLQK